MTIRQLPLRRSLAVGAALVAAGIGGAVIARAHQRGPNPRERVAAATPLVTGKGIEPQGEQTAVGSFPDHLLLSPSGRFVVASGSGARSFVSVLDASTGKLISQVGFNGPGKGMAKKKKAAREGLYYGLAFGAASPDGGALLYAARGADAEASVLRLSADGQLVDTGKVVTPPDDDPKGAGLKFVAGLAVTGDGNTLIAANDTMDAAHLDSAVYLLDASTGAVKGSVAVPGYPFAIRPLTAGPDAGRKVYVGSEQQPVVSVIDPIAGKLVGTVKVGSHPIAMALDRANARLFVANANSDTVSVVDTRTDAVTGTVVLRPTEMRGLTGATPTGLALSPDEKTLYVSLADLDAVAVVDVAAETVRGYIPVGWYPSSVVVSPDGKRLFVANAKGVRVRTPNTADFPPAVAAGGYRPRYIQSLLEGTVSTIGLAEVAQNLPVLTQTALAANHFYAGLPEAAAHALNNPGIEHIIYIIKENRTYDQVLGDLPQGNGDKRLVMFGRDVTPNLHALAERFVLLDNFYCCAEVSADGWNWSTSGIANEFTARNVPYEYTGRKHDNDFKGTNVGVPVERLGVPDAATAENGYIWDQTAKAGLPFRNYGFFTGGVSKANAQVDETEEGAEGAENTPYKKALVGTTDADFRQFDLTYADSEGWVKLALPRFLKRRAYGAHDAPARITEWRREFDQYVKNGNLPRFEMVRLGTDHTRGTTATTPAPRAFVADNDFAIGQLVEAVSHSPYWKSTAIFVLEDDAQNGEDHVDCHRSTAYVISPFIRSGTRDSAFHNTDSFLHTMDCLMGLPPLNQYVAIAPPIADFGAAPINDAPYTAILPNKAILSERNTRTAYRANDSARFYSAADADAGPDAAMNDILWHAVKGVGVPEPAARHGVRTGTAISATSDDRD